MTGNLFWMGSVPDQAAYIVKVSFAVHRIHHSDVDQFIWKKTQTKAYLSFIFHKIYEDWHHYEMDTLC